MEITVGCDPEFFVTQGGKFRSAHGLVPGTKEEPFVVDKGAYQVDGMALEFNIDPVTTEDDFVLNIRTVLDRLRADVDPSYEFAFVPSCRFNGSHFKAQPDEAKELGCTPDYNAYTLQENPKPDNKTTMRTASGHIHLGGFPSEDFMGDDHMIKCGTLMKQLDVYLGLPSVVFDNDKDRRSMYGAAGAFRPKPYGAEYRVLSNAWLLSEARQRFVFRQAKRAVQDLMKGVRPANAIGEEVLANTINRSKSYNAGILLQTYVPDGVAMFEEARALVSGLI